MAPTGIDEVVANLRRLAATQPKLARSQFQALLKGEESTVRELLNLVSSPGDGRLRQLVATIFRTDQSAGSLEPWLRKWQEAEPDEFTRAAISSALANRQASATVERSSPRATDALALEAYRYVADRLCHRIRNALMLPSARLVHLEQLLPTVDDPGLRDELTEILGGFSIGLHRIARTVEFDTSDDYLTWQKLPLIEWLESIAPELTARFGSAQFTIACDATVRRCRVRATRFHLDTIFSNLWSNALQATGSTCRIELRCAFDSRRGVLEVLVLDSGPGLDEQHLETAFQNVFSTRGISRGRGLLEIANSVRWLQGEVELTEVSAGEYRVRICLPTEA